MSSETLPKRASAPASLPGIAQRDVLAGASRLRMAQVAPKTLRSGKESIITSGSGNATNCGSKFTRTCANTCAQWSDGSGRPAPRSSTVNASGACPLTSRTVTPLGNRCPVLCAEEPATPPTHLDRGRLRRRPGRLGAGGVALRRRNRKRHQGPLV